MKSFSSSPEKKPIVLPDLNINAEGEDGFDDIEIPDDMLDDRSSTNNNEGDSNRFSDLYEDSPAERLGRFSMNDSAHLSPRYGASGSRFRANCIAILFFASVGAMACTCISLLKLLSVEKETE